MHDAKMNPTDLGGIVVDQADRLRVECTLNRKLFAHLPLDSLLKRLQADLKSEMVFVIIVDVATDADGSFGGQTLLASLLAANIVENAFSVSDYHIRNNLFEIWICFRFRARQKTVVLWIKNCRQIIINISIETLKNAQPLKKRAGKNENIFVCDSHIQSSIQKPESRSQNLAD